LPPLPGFPPGPPWLAFVGGLVIMGDATFGRVHRPGDNENPGAKEDTFVANRKWMLLAMLLCFLLSTYLGCDCGDDDDDDSGDDDDDDNVFPDDDADDDDSAQDDDIDFGPCPNWSYLCLIGAQGDECVDVYPEDEFEPCQEHCDELNAQAILADEDYCVCCKWF